MICADWRSVIAGLDPAIHPLDQDSFCEEEMDARVKPAHDGAGERLATSNQSLRANCLSHALVENRLELRNAGPAIRSSPQGGPDLGDAGGSPARNRIVQGIQADAKAGADGPTRGAFCAGTIRVAGEEQHAHLGLDLCTQERRHRIPRWQPGFSARKKYSRIQAASDHARKTEGATAGITVEQQLCSRRSIEERRNP